MNDSITRLFRHPLHVISILWGKQVRVHDFAQRTKGATPATQVYLHPRGYGRYLPIHPFADEDDLLQQLGMTPPMCRHVDAYWHYDDDVCFLEVGVMADDSLQRHGLFARTMKGQQLNIMAFIAEEAIYRTTFETIMEACAQSGVMEQQEVIRLNHEWRPL